MPCCHTLGKNIRNLHRRVLVSADWLFQHLGWFNGVRTTSKRHLDVAKGDSEHYINRPTTSLTAFLRHGYQRAETEPPALLSTTPHSVRTMFKFEFFLAILSLVLFSVSASEVTQEDAVAFDGTVREYPKCPCKCFGGRKKRKAKRQCRRFRFRYHCAVKECALYGRYYNKGLMCCDKLPSVSVAPTPSTTSTATATPSRTPIPTSTATATPSRTPYPSTTSTATATPSSSPIPPRCPCVCEKRYFANKACVYKPHCQVTVCPGTAHHGYQKWQCCDKPYVAPHH